jgi:CrcB protein
MNNLLLIGLGGFIGAILRYGISDIVQGWSRGNAFPIGTLAVNILGCFVIGLLTQLAEAHGLFSPQTRSLLFIGFLGAFTTFSTFGNDTMNLLQGTRPWLSITNVSAHIVLGLIAIWAGQGLSWYVWK